MIVGLYTGASSMISQGDYQAVIARNLANINTVGYKKNVAVFQSYISQLQDKDTSAAPHGIGSSLNTIATDFSQGTLEYTGNDLDISIKGEGFFVVKADTGISYTRKGQFMLSRDMKLVTPEGWPLLGHEGEIQVPQKTKNITIKENGSVFADGREIGSIKIASVPNLTALEPIGGCAYKLSDAVQQPKESTDFKIAQRYLERSNVNAIDEMVNMMPASRSYQNSVDMMNTTKSLLQKTLTIGQ